MTDEVMLSVVGLQDEAGDDGRTELITTGKYYMKNGRHYLEYNDESSGETIKNTIRIADGRMDVMRSGGVRSHMPFKMGENSITLYPTPAGDLPMAIFTDYVTCDISEDTLIASVRYSLSLDDVFISKCTVTVTAHSRQAQEPFGRH